MSFDLNSLVNDWPHEPGAIKVRKIIGLDGREKLQLRIDLGLLQMEMQGRPDGRRPHNAESLLVYHQRRAARAEARGENYELTAEQCSDLQQEGIQYYHRYLSLFQINEFAGVIRDTQRNLDLFNFVAEHAERDERHLDLPAISALRADDEHASQGFDSSRRWQICRCHARDRGAGATPSRSFLQQSNFPELVSKSSEIAFLEEWLEEVRAKRPLSRLEIMQREMEIAISREMYERAAELRDAIRLLQAGSELERALRARFEHHRLSENYRFGYGPTSRAGRHELHQKSV